MLFRSKLYGAEAGRQGIGLLRFSAASVAARGARAVGVGAVVGIAARKAEPVLKRFFGPYVGLATIGYAVGLSLVLRRWRRTGSPGPLR